MLETLLKELRYAGGGPGNKDLKPLNLTPEEKRALKTFLVEALSGEDLDIMEPEIPE